MNVYQLRGIIKYRSKYVWQFLFALFLSVFSHNIVFGKDQINIVAFGDSLTAGYQLPGDQSFPSQLERELKASGYNVKVSNSGSSGDTTSGGLARLDWSVAPGTDIVILELGANDVLRGITPDVTRKNLEKIISKLVGRGIRVLLAGMKPPTSYGPEYERQFGKIYSDLARKYNLVLYPFFLEGVALKPELNLSDGLHPNAKGVLIIVKNILPSVVKLIKDFQKK